MVDDRWSVTARPWRLGDAQSADTSMTWVMSAGSAAEALSRVALAFEGQPERRSVVVTIERTNDVAQ